jgi:hypothetical protein
LKTFFCKMRVVPQDKLFDHWNTGRRTSLLQLMQTRTLPMSTRNLRNQWIGKLRKHAVCWKYVVYFAQVQWKPLWLIECSRRTCTRYMSKETNITALRYVYLPTPWIDCPLLTLFSDAFYQS